MSREHMGRPRAETAFLIALVKSQLAASFALRAAFWLSAAFMLLNNFLFFSTWWILMERFGHVRGWQLADVMCLFAVAASGFGLCVISCGGLPDLSRKVDDGELDAFLTQPKSVLLQALASRTQASGWGDLATGVALLVLSDAVSLSNLPWVVVAVLCSFVTFTACGVLMHSLAFWLGRTHALSRALWEFTLTFSLYPSALFGSGLKVVLFTLMPAGLVSYLPVELLRRPSLSALLACVLGTAAYASFALWIFSRGLRRYASGNRFSVKA